MNYFLEGYKMQMTKRQHYLPQFYLDNFTNNNGKLWIYDRLNENIFSSSSRDIACEKYLYETRWENANPDLGDFVLPNQIEKKFAEQEGRYSKLLKRIVSTCTNAQNKKALICNREEKEVMASFVSNTFLRNPWTMRQADLDCVTGGIMDTEEIKAFDYILQSMKLDGIESLVKFSGKKIWLDEEFDGGIQQKSKKILQSMNFCFFLSKSSEFVTSNFPVLNGIDETTEKNEEMTYFPLHPQIAILYGNSIPRIAWNRVIPIAEEDTDSFNKKYINSDNEKNRFIYAKEKKILERLM